MIKTISNSAGVTGKAVLKKVFLFCGILSSLYYVAVNIIVPMQYEGYNIASQTVSELSAINAPTRELWVSLLVVYTILMIAFGYGVWISGREKKTLRIAGALIITYSILGIFWPPMHHREVLAAGGATLTDTLHIVWTAVTVIMMLLIIWFGGASFGNEFRLYSILTVLVLVGFGTITSMNAPQLEANLPTPWVGVWERICMGAYMLWIIVFAVVLLQHEKKTEPAS